MKDRITINGRDGTFAAYIARPQVLPAPAVIILQRLLGIERRYPAKTMNWPRMTQGEIFRRIHNGRTTEALRDQAVWSIVSRQVSGPPAR
jgi:hypothetical protein